MAYDFWSNVQIRVESARATALTVSAVSKANPAVATYTGTDPTNGDYVVFDNVSGMTQIDKRVFRVANVNGAGNTFELEGVDSTGFGTFTAGEASVVTLGLSMTNVQDVNSSGGEPEFADLTTIHDTTRRRAPTVTSPFSMSFGCLFKPSDSAMVELSEAHDTLTERAIRIDFPSGKKAAFLAYVSASGIPTGGAQEVVKTNVSFEGQGKPTVYTT